MSDSMILKEYLLAIGFKLDEKSSREFDKWNEKLGKSATTLAKSALGAAAGVAAMAHQFASSMEALYYSSRKADSAVGNIQALEYAGKQIGLAGGSMQKSLEGMARAMRANPGLQSMLESLGVPVTGRDKADVLTDFVTQLKGMPFYVAQQFGQMFGIDPDDLLLLEQGLDDFKRLREERKKMAEEAGVNTDQAAEAAKEYMQMWRRINEQVSLLNAALYTRMLPVMRDIAGFVGGILDKWTKIVSRETPSSFFEKLAEGLGLKTSRANSGQGIELTPYAKQRLKELGGPSALPPIKPAPGAPVGPRASTALFNRLETQYGLPSGFLDRMWAQESGRGTRMTSPKGALGHFQFMPATAADEGLNDPNNLEESATAAARYMAKLLARYGGNLQAATAAYNWGMGNVDRQGLSKAPWETRQYVQALTGAPIQVEQTNHFHLDGGSGDSGVVDGIGRRLDTANGNLVRNLSGAIR